MSDVMTASGEVMVTLPQFTLTHVPYDSIRRWSELMLISLMHQVIPLSSSTSTEAASMHGTPVA